MAKIGHKQIRDVACKIVHQNPGGIRYSELVRAIQQLHPETPINTIHGSVWDLAEKEPNSVRKPSRGLFVPNQEHGQVGNNEEPVEPVVNRVRESEFYKPFADWLVKDLDEATIAVPLGGASIQRKWGTPDIVGVYKPRASHRIRFSLEILAAEVKIDPQQPVVAFGQAAAYRLFASKSYVVMPDNISEEDYSRLEALCMLYGIGLVLFSPQPDAPDFRIRVRAQRASPDMFYVNAFAERIYEIDPSVFDELFG